MISQALRIVFSTYHSQQHILETRNAEIRPTRERLHLTNILAFPYSYSCPYSIIIAFLPLLLLLAASSFFLEFDDRLFAHSWAQLKGYLGVVDLIHGRIAHICMKRSL